MTWDKTPWFIGNGAEHSPEVARLVLFASTGGAEGIADSGDLKVLAQGSPGGSVRVMPGAALLVNRSAGGAQQSYGGRNPTEDVVAVAATGTGGGRSDLVIARVEDPQYSPWQAPGDPTSAQYIFTRVIQNVPAGTTDARALNLGYPAIALARIDIPAGTGAISQAMIKDVRKLARPRNSRHTLIQTPTAAKAFTTALVDHLTFGSVDIPTWATHMILRGDLAGIVLRTATSNAEMRVRLGAAFTQVTAATEEAGRRLSMLSAGEIFIVPEARGGVRDVAIQVRKSDGGTGAWSTDQFSTGVIDLQFVEKAE